MGALFHRERTGRRRSVDVSLLGTGMWAMGQAFALSLLLERAVGRPAGGCMRRNPLVRNYLTKDGRCSRCAACRPATTGPSCAASIGRPGVGTDPRFADHAALLEQQPRGAGRDPEAAFAERTVAEWRERLADFTGQWSRRAGHTGVRGRPAERRQRLLAGRQDRGGRAVPDGRRTGAVRRGAGRRLAGRRSSTSTATPSSRKLGIDWDTIVDLKVRGVVA